MADIEKIKLLILTPALHCGGSEKYVSLLCNNINTQKFDVTLVVLDNSTPFYTINNAAITIVNLKVKHARNSLFKILAVAKHNKPAIILSTANHLNLYLAIFKNWLPKNIVLIARESSIVSSNSKRAKLPAIYTWLSKKYYKRIDYVICQSLYMQQDLVNNFNIDKNKTVVINNAVEITAASPVDFLDNSTVKKAKFITVARLSEEKGIDRLIHAVAKLSLPFSYHIIGSGNKQSYLQRLINELGLQNNVFLDGEKHDPFIGMKDADLFLMGSHYEGFPNTVLEANALGIPVLAFDVPGGINEIILPPVNGLLVKDADENAFARAIEKALQMNFNREQIRIITQQKFSAAYIFGQVEALFIKIYDQIK